MPQAALSLPWPHLALLPSPHLQPTFRTPLTPAGNIAVPPAGVPRFRDGRPGSAPGAGRLWGPYPK